MKKLILITALFFIGSFAQAKGGGGGHSGGGHSGGGHSSHSSRSHSGKAARGTGANRHAHKVRTYVKKNGTVVQQHRQSDSNGTVNDNWGTKGNRNPDTGKAGSR